MTWKNCCIPVVSCSPLTGNAPHLKWPYHTRKCPGGWVRDSPGPVRAVKYLLQPNKNWRRDTEKIRVCQNRTKHFARIVILKFGDFNFWNLPPLLDLILPCLLWGWQLIVEFWVVYWVFVRISSTGQTSNFLFDSNKECYSLTNIILPCWKSIWRSMQ